MPPPSSSMGIESVLDETSGASAISTILPKHPTHPKADGLSYFSASADFTGTINGTV